VAAAAAALAAAVLALGGSLGWIAKDRKTRAATTAAEVAQALDDSLHWQGQGRVPEALAAARRALAALAAGGGDEALRRSVQARVADLDLLHRLEEARLEMPLDKSGDYDLAFADRRYGVVFGAFGLEVAALPAAAAGQQIAGSSVATELAAFLDHWAELCRRLTPRDEARCQHLLAVARAADADGWRGQLREALAGEDRQALLRLASSDEATRLLPWTCRAVGFTLARAGSPGPAEALLRQAQQRHPDDFWINYSLADLLFESKGAPGEASRAEEGMSFWRVCVALRPQSPGPHNNLGVALKEKGRLDEAISEYQEALRLNKDFALAHTNLGLALYDKGRLDEAIAQHKEALRLNKDFADAHNNLGLALQRKGRLDEAIAQHKEALRLNKNDPMAHNNLGAALQNKGQMDEAIAEYQGALRLNKDYPEAHDNLGVALQRKGRLDEAIAEYQEALRLKKDYPAAHNNLGLALKAKGQLNEAIAEFRQALRLNKDDPIAHNNLGQALHENGRLDEAIAEYREAIRLKRDYSVAHNNLGKALAVNGQLDEAITEFRDAVRLKNDYPEAHENLSKALQIKGALEKLPRILKGDARPTDAAECLALAGLCQEPYQQLYAASVRFYREVFVTQPNLAANLGAGHRYNAACAAALAGCGQGKDATDLGAKERTRLRLQALDWLRADLGAWRTVLEKGPEQARPAVATQMQHWQQDSDFAGVRGTDALGRLPQAEAADWQRLWAEVADTLARAQGKTNPPKNLPMK
jgi:tetratricopeptide (TPR) repeat protein